MAIKSSHFIFYITTRLDCFSIEVQKLMCKPCNVFTPLNATYACPGLK